MGIDITKGYAKTAKLVDEQFKNGDFAPDCLSTPGEIFKEALHSFQSIQTNLGHKDAGHIAYELVKASHRLLHHSPELFHHWPTLGRAVGAVASKKGMEEGLEALDMIKSSKAFGRALPFQQGAFYNNVRAMCPSESGLDVLAQHLHTHQ